MGAAYGYSPEQQSEGQRLMILEGLFSRGMEALISGVILAGFALALGANDLEVGLLAAIPFLAHLVHIPAVHMLARTHDRRGATVRWAVMGRLMLFLIALLPLVTLPVSAIHLLIPLLAAYAIFANLSSAFWQAWVRDLVPRDALGSYFSRRMAILTTVGVIVTLAAGQFVTWWRRAHPETGTLAFGLLFALAALLGLTSSVIVSRAPMLPATLSRMRLSETLRKPLKEHNFRRILVFLAAWGFAANFSLPFISVVMIKTLGYGLATVVAFAALSSVANILALRLWGPATDRFGNKPVMGLGASVFVFAIFAWAVTPKDPGAFVLVSAGVVHILLGLATAALDLGSNNIVMKVAPDDDVPAFLATASVAKSVATGIAPLMGGIVAALLVDRAFTVRLAFTGPTSEQVVTALRFAHYDFLFLTSAVLGLYAIHRLLGFAEEGEAPPERVVRALRRDVGQFSSVAGMRQFAHLASYVVETAYRIERTLDVRRVMEDDEDEDDRAGEGR